MLAAARLAAPDAAVNSTAATATRIGMIFGTCTGPLETVGKLTETIGQPGPGQGEPAAVPQLGDERRAPGTPACRCRSGAHCRRWPSACASGLTRVSAYAADLIRAGEADVMLAVSADELTPLLHLGYDQLGLLDRRHDAARTSGRLDRVSCSGRAGSR